MPCPAVIRLSWPGAISRQAADAVAVQHLAVDQPRHGLQAAVRMRRHLHAGAVGDHLRAEMVEETPGADHAPVRMRQQPAHHGVAAERHITTLEQVGAIGDRHAPAGLDLRWLRLQVAHRSNVRANGSGNPYGQR